MICEEYNSNQFCVYFYPLKNELKRSNNLDLFFSSNLNIQDEYGKRDVYLSDIHILG